LTSGGTKEVSHVAKFNRKEVVTGTTCDIWIFPTCVWWGTTTKPADAFEKGYVMPKIYSFIGNLKISQMERQPHRS
jgi:hypothetical protein